MSLRQKLEPLEQFLLDVILERRYGKRAALFRALLKGLSRIYEAVVQFRLYCYQQRLFRDHALGIQVISVGNLTVGGTGKTPVVERIARSLQSRGRKVAILSRGYKSTPRPLRERLWNALLLRTDKVPPKIVSDGKYLLLDSDMAGDEPFMLASNLKDVVVLVDKDRVKSARYAVEHFGVDTIVLDDGFQYLRLKPWKQRLNRKHFDFVLVDCQSPWGNNHLLPRGILREPPPNIKRATHIFITKSDGKNAAAIKKELNKLNPFAEIIECRHEPLYLEDVFTHERRELDFLQGLKIGAISGIAKPESFEHGLQKLGAQIIYSKRFADHHRFDQQEIINMINGSRRREAQAIITTEKDAVRFPKIDRRDLPVFFLRVEVKIISGNESFEQCIARLCFEDPRDQEGERRQLTGRIHLS